MMRSRCRCEGMTEACRALVPRSAPLNRASPCRGGGSAARGGQYAGAIAERESSSQQATALGLPLVVRSRHAEVRQMQGGCGKAMYCPLDWVRPRADPQNTPSPEPEVR